MFIVFCNNVIPFWSAHLLIKTGNSHNNTKYHHCMLPSNPLRRQKIIYSPFERDHKS